VSRRPSGGGKRGEATPESPTAEVVAAAPETPASTATEPKAAATPSCPQCQPGAIAPASEVLLSFLSESQHDDWARSRFIVAQGGLSGHNYLIAHRHTRLAQHVGRICYDLDARCVVHFHDWRVPPEEEVLAAKLILESRFEPWLRNEATMLGCWDNSTLVFKNPFGDGLDGVIDAQLTQQIGRETLKALSRELIRESAVQALRLLG